MDSAPPVTATDSPADSEAPARVCERPECDNPAPKGRTGRPKQYCSRSCRSKADRAKLKAREAAAAVEAAAPAAAPDPAAATPAPAAAPVAATPAPAAAPDLAAPAATPVAATPTAAVRADDDRWGEDGRYLLGIADALHRKLAAFLEETATGDPVAAFEELRLRLPGYSQRAFSTGQKIRDKARWPDLTDDERHHRRMLERIDLSKIPDFDPNAPIPGLDDDQEPASFASRGETEAAGQHQDQGQPAGESVGTASPAALPRQHNGDLLRPPPEPYLRGLGRYDVIRNATALLGPGWDLVGWSRAPGLFYVRKDGRALGWIEHGAGRVDGWAVLVDGQFLVDGDRPERPLACASADDAALLVRQALDQGLLDTADPAADRADPGPAPGPEVGAPTELTPAQAAEQVRREACTDPETRFDFPDYLDDLSFTFGPGWEQGRWIAPEAEGVLQLRLDGEPVGWTAPLPDGPWGLGGPIALLYQRGAADRLLTDNHSRPKRFPDTDLALDAVLRQHQGANALSWPVDR
ncbi:hypothetical protein ACFWA9_30985 [Kitasatospora sp. NPDC059973]|uniref:hypothetical protein n=1 Tax=Kitasatospora sp. NPDC059973 TaxID=3347020 RepID=UPI00369ADC3A